MNARTMKWAGALALVAGSSGALAASDWSAGFSTCTTYGNEATTVTCPDVVGGVNAVTVTAVGTDSYTAGADFALRDVNYYSGGGLGVDPLGGSQTSPEHAIDNNAWIDAVVVKFDSSVILNEVTLGWRQYDWDFSVFAYTGGGVPLTYTNGVTSLTTPTMELGSTLGGGWTLVSNYAAVAGCSTACGTATTITGLNSANVSSSWWVISAYSDAYGTSNRVGSSYASNLETTTKDYFKLLTVAGNYYSPPPPPPPTGVPEPGSMALAGLAFFGVLASRRRKVHAA